MANTGRSESRKFPIAIWIFGILSFFGFFSWINANLPSTKDQAEKLDKTEIDTQIVKTSPEPSLEPEPSFSPKSIFEPIVSSTPTTMTTIIPFDTDSGNNYVAAKYAQGIMDTTNKAVPNFILESFLELNPEDLKGENEETYKGKVSSAFLTIKVNNLYWNQMDDDSKKDIVGSLVVSVGNIFPGGYPHITVGNGTRTVASGEYNWLKTEPKVTLK